MRPVVFILSHPVHPVVSRFGHYDVPRDRRFSPVFRGFRDEPRAPSKSALWQHCHTRATPARQARGSGPNPPAFARYARTAIPAFLNPLGRLRAKGASYA